MIDLDYRQYCKIISIVKNGNYEKSFFDVEKYIIKNKILFLKNKVDVVYIGTIILTKSLSKFNKFLEIFIQTSDTYKIKVFYHNFDVILYLPEDKGNKPAHNSEMFMKILSEE